MAYNEAFSSGRKTGEWIQNIGAKDNDENQFSVALRVPCATFFFCFLKRKFPYQRLYAIRKIPANTHD